MKVAISLCAFVALLLIGWMSWVLLSHEPRTVRRLIDAGVVASPAGVKLLYSTGYLRENTHLFECSDHAVLTPSKGGIELDPLDLKDPYDRDLIEVIRASVDEHASTRVDWNEAKISVGDGKGLLSLVFVIKVRGKTFAVLQMF